VLSGIHFISAKNVRSCLESNNQGAVSLNVNVVTPFLVHLEPYCVEWDSFHQSNKETGDEKWHLAPPLKGGATNWSNTCI